VTVLEVEGFDDGAILVGTMKRKTNIEVKVITARRSLLLGIMLLEFDSL